MQDFTKFLNPVFNHLDEISDTATISPSNPLEEEEYPHLIQLLGLVKKDLDKGHTYMKKLEEQLEHFLWIIDNETGDDKSDAIKMYNKLLVEMENLVERMNRSLDIVDAPYFGKIIFNRHKSDLFPEKELPIYIGKFAYFDKESNKPLISDWRAPISNLYYMYSGPTDDISFESPAGKQSGDLKQKRQFELANGRFDQIYDIQSGNNAADQYLLTQLDRRVGKKLQEIVSTIQTQQNEIIRAPINKPMIIQGVAGSGKTTIILHRLAYLFYTYPQEIKPEESLIIAPNNVFLDYIADVLPSLGVKGISQDTFLFWARDVLKLSDKFILYEEKSAEVDKFKGSLQFVDLISQYLEYFESKFFEEMPSSVSIDIEEQYHSLKERDHKMSMRELIDLAIEGAFMQRKISRKGAMIDTRKYQAEQKRSKDVTNYVRKSLDVYKIYKDIFKDESFKPSVEIEPGFWKKVVKESVEGFNKERGFRGYSMNDLAGMLMIEAFVNGSTDHIKDQIIVDEAQDLSPMELSSLTTFAKKGNITLAGDTAQSIVPPFHNIEWDGVLKMLDEKTGKETLFFELNKSYRSTHEIISFANKVLLDQFPHSYKLPEAVLRHGDEVSLHEYKDKKDWSQKLLGIIKKEIQLEKPTIAILTKEEVSADEIHSKLLQEDLQYQIFSYKEENFHSGIQILPIKYAKGLEFDTVVIADLDSENYSNTDDARLLYVSMTRGLHKLHILADSDKPSKLLPDELVKSL